MLTFALDKKRPAAASRSRQVTSVGVSDPSWQARQARIRNVLHGPTVQPKLTIGAPNDVYEQEAERVADAVLRMPEPRHDQTAPLRNSPPAIQRLCTECEDDLQRQSIAEGEELIQTKASGRDVPEPTAHTERGIAALNGGGAPLPGGLRAYFEGRLGYDFAAVRLHTGGNAARTAQALNARAYTMGSDLVFAEGQYSPGTREGKRLIAHELAHVIQQTGGVSGSAHGTNTADFRQPSPGRPVDPHEPVNAQRNDRPSIVRRDEDEAAAKQDFVLLMSPGLTAEAAVLAPGAQLVRVATPEEMADALRALEFPIKTLFIISHSLASGDLGFESGNRTSFVRPETLAEKLAGSLAADRAPELIDFRGCSLGSSPPGMEKIRAVLGAKAAVAGNCFMITWIQGPVVLDETRITSRSQISSGSRPGFEAGLRLLVDSFKRAADCILDRSEDAYFRAAGKMVAQWASPEFSTDWDERKSLCYKDLSVVPVDPSTTPDASPGIAGHCKLIRIEEPTADGTAPAAEEVEAAEESTSAEPAAEPVAEPETAEHPPDRRWTLSASLGAELEPDLRRLAGLIGAQLSLRTGSHVVFNPRIGLHLLHITEPNDEAGRLSAAMLDLGLRIQQPLHGAYLDLEVGGFEGFKAELGGPSEATRGLTLGSGVGWRWERLELGAEARTLLPLTEGDPNRVLVVGRVALRF